MGVVCDVRLVGYEDDGVAACMKLIEQVHDFHARFGLNFSGGVVGEVYVFFVPPRGLNGKWFALPAGQLVRLMEHSTFKANIGKCPFGAFNSLGCRRSVVNEWQLDVMQGGGAGQQIEGLKDETDFLVSNACQLVIVQLTDELPIEPVLAFGGSVEAADQIHERGLARSGWTHDRDILIVADPHRDPAQRLDLLFRTHVIGSPEVFNHDHVAGRGAGLGRLNLGADNVQSHANHILCGQLWKTFPV